MSLFSHILFITAMAQILHFRGFDIFLAFLFGVLVDLDHLVKLPLYLKKHKLKLYNIFTRKFLQERYYNWRTPLQEPVALLWIIPFSIYINSFVPIIAFLSHLFLDYLIGYRKFPFFPFSDFSTKGLSLDIPEKIRELTVIFILLCLNLFLFFIK